ncbi:MAG TPA: glyoxalase/bleomycin resistance/extradiol dioxygenase family protein [Chitinophagaceae bacterium]|nr:glyoxalase/bleomycin resistance/extradiol dioxygenase family protein [Chitinophagaceae bacterium]
MKLTPYLNFEGNAQEALDFYTNALGGQVVYMQRYGDSPMPGDEDYKNKVMHARLQFGDNMIMVSDAMKGYEVSTKGNIQLSMEMDSVSQLEEVFNKIAEGGKITMPLADQFWGARFGMLQDKFGVSWMFNCDLKK